MSNEKEFKTPNERLDKFKDLNEATDNETNRTANNHVENGEYAEVVQPDAYDGEDLRETLGGATNLSLDQLKEDDGQPTDNQE